MPPVPDRGTFETAYAGQAPWDIGRPQKAFLDVADQITGSILDAGCGTGENALFFASRGQKVTGIDFLAEPITRAKKKAAEGGVTARAIASYFLEKPVRIWSSTASSQPARKRLPRRLSFTVVSFCKIDSASRRSMPRFSGL